MNESELDNNVSQMLKEYEALDNIIPSPDWNKSLMGRLASSQSYSPAKFPAAKFTFAILFLILINIGFILNMMISGSQLPSHRNTELQVVSQELLINPISTNN